MFDAKSNKHAATDGVFKQPAIVNEVSNESMVTDAWSNQPAMFDAESEQHLVNKEVSAQSAIVYVLSSEPTLIGSGSGEPIIVNEVSNELIVTDTVLIRHAVTDVWSDQPAVFDADSKQQLVTQAVSAQPAIVDAILNKPTSMGELGTSHYFSTMNIGPNVADTKFGVVSLGTSHYFSKMAALRPIFIVMCYLPHAAVSTPSPSSNLILRILSLNTPTPPMMSNICVCNYINCFTHIA